MSIVRAPTGMDRRLLLAGLAVALLPGRPVEAEPSCAAAEAFERATGGRLGLYAENVASGAKITWRANERFVMCSTFKASLAALVLARVDRGEDRLDAPVRFGPAALLPYAPVAQANLAKGVMSVADMAQAAVELSDNTCANLLLARVGGPEALTAFWRATGDRVSRLDHDEPSLNRSPPGDPRDTTTAAAIAGTLRRLILGDVLSPASRNRLAGWLVDCRTGRDRLRAGLPADWRVGDKTGNNGADAAGDIAVAWPKPERPILICVFTQGGTPDAAHLADVFAQVGRCVARRLA